MRALAVLLMAAGPVLADPPSVRVCVPVVTMDRIAAYLAGQPWRDVAPFMEALRAVAAAPSACPDPAKPEPTKPEPIAPDTTRPH